MKLNTGAVHDNTPLKITYRLEQPPTQKWFAEKSGPIPIYKTTVEQHTTPGLSHIAGMKQRMAQGERELFPPVIFGHLKKRLAVVFGLDRAQFSWFSPMLVKKTQAALRVQAMPGVSANSGSLTSDNPIELEPKTERECVARTKEPDCASPMLENPIALQQPSENSPI